MTTPARRPAPRDLRSLQAQQARSTARRLARQQKLLEVLLAQRLRPVSVDYLSEELGVSERTVERELEALRAARLPLVSRGGRGGGVWLDVTRTRSAIALADEQVMALLLALDVLDAELPPILDETRAQLRAQLNDPLLF